MGRGRPTLSCGPVEQLSEHEVQTAILEEFGSKKWCRVWRANTGVARPLNDPQAVVRYGIKGQSDCTGLLDMTASSRWIDHGLGLPTGVRLEIECKSQRNRRGETDDQARWGKVMRRFGAVYVVARSVEDVWNVLEPMGFER